MKTEEVARQMRRPGQVVSRALQDLAPLAAEVINERGQGVPLSTAGYVLRAGGRYRLRILMPADGDLLAVQVIAAADFVCVFPEVVTPDDHNRRIHDIPFQVKRELRATLYRPVSCDKIEVHLNFRPDPGKAAPPCSYPLVVRPGLSLVSVTVVVSLLSVFAPVLLHGFFKENLAELDFWTQLGDWLADPRLWVALVIIASVPLLVYGISLWQLARRARELRLRFDERYTV
jgi:hypothetical protein